MTSYATANESSPSSSPPSGATTASKNTQQQPEQHQTYTATTTKAMQQEQGHHQQHVQHHDHHNQGLQQNPHIQQHFSDCECDLLSDGREKADMTPENIKKIDDIIELELEMERSKRQQQHQHQQQQRNDANIAAIISTAADDVSDDSNALHLTESDSVGYSGLNVVDDELHEKFFSTKNPALSEKEVRLMERIRKATGDSQQIESPIQSLTDTTSATTPKAITGNGSESAVAFEDSLTNSNTSVNINRTTSSPVTSTTKTPTATHSVVASTTAKTGQEESETETDGGGNSKRSCAFTLNFDNNDANAAAATAARYKSVMERFQNRHRRGTSMSKLDDQNGHGSDRNAAMTSSLTGDGLNNSSSASLTLRSVGKSQQKHIDAAAAGEDSTIAIAQVKLRPRDRSTSRVRDAAKRHSWSPRSSTNELSAAPAPVSPVSTAARQAQQRPPTSARRNTAAAKNRPPPTPTPAPPPPHPVVSKDRANLLTNRTQQFTPRSTAMQLALQKIDFLCPQSPLVDCERASGGDGDDVSETGTYTLDGDNYTEEQKDLMNIDKNTRGGRKQRKHDHHHHNHHHHHHQQHSEQHDDFVSGDGGDGSTGEGLSQITPAITKIPVRTNNVLEVNYFHNEADETGNPRKDEFFVSPHPKSSKKAPSDFLLANHPSAGAYLEQIKFRVLRKHAEPTAHPTVKDAEDVGCFTSVTTSGVLAKQSALDPRPKLSLLRKNSLTTSQIDSSEYVSNEAKLKNAPATDHVGSYTDMQKAEYRLNLFTNQKDLHKHAATRNLIETPPETPVVTTDRFPSDTAALTMAKTKNDWIQQWARNARARSLASDTCVGKQKQQQQHQHQKASPMTRSYNCGGTSPSVAGGSLTDDSLFSHQLNAIACYHGSDNEFDYSSDPSLLTSVAYAQAQDGNGSASVKPPKSPSKIPSPLHSIGRTRSASRTRGSLQGLMTPTTPTMAAATQDLDLEDDGQDVYLQKTAAAINSLQQSLSRKNSLKSPPGSSPRMSMNKARSHQLALQSNEDGDSPQRSIDSDGYQTSQHHHRRNLSNESASQSQTQAQLMTSSFNEQQLKLLTTGEYLIKQMRMRKNSFDGNICSPSRRRMEQPVENASSVTTARSPLHRGKVSNAAGLQQRAARPQYQNIYTPPAARQGNGPLAQLFSNQYQHQSHPHPHQQPQLIMKKSASSNNFGQAYKDYEDNLEYYINDADEADEEADSSLGHEDADGEGEGEGDELEYGDYGEYSDANEGYEPHTITLHAATIDDAPAMAPLTSTRYNKALLMRIQRSKQRVAAASGGSAGGKPTSAPAGSKSTLANVAGLVACPNTPELPRRNVKSAPRSSTGNSRQSVPRDTSLSRLASQVPNSLASAKRQLLQTAAAANQRVQPKYLDISKYKPVQGNAFLRKNEAKSTLKIPSSSGDVGGGGIRRSPSSSGLSRNDQTRASNRSIRSAMTSSCTGSIGGGISSGNISGNSQRAFSAVRRDDSVSKQKEIEMAIWKRRSTYDPLKAAAEDRRRKEEAKRLAMAKNANDIPCERRSRSHHRRGQF